MYWNGYSHPMILVQIIRIVICNINNINEINQIIQIMWGNDTCDRKCYDTYMCLFMIHIIKCYSNNIYLLQRQ